MLGSSPVAIPTSFENTKFPSVEDKLQQLQKDREEALAAHELARKRMAERRKNKFTGFKLGQQVWLDTRNVKTRYHSKMAPKREGPFKISEILGPLTYRLQLPATWRIHNVFHAVLLMPYTETEVHGPNYLRPPPDIENDEERWEIEAIRNHRQRGRNGYQYEVLWKGYPITKTTWEPATCFKNGGEEILREYRHRHRLDTNEQRNLHLHTRQPRRKGNPSNDDGIQSEKDVARICIPSSRSYTANGRRTSRRLLRTIFANTAISLSQNQTKTIGNVLRAKYTASSRLFKNSTYTNK